MDKKAQSAENYLGKGEKQITVILAEPQVPVDNGTMKQSIQILSQGINIHLHLMC